MSFNIVDLVKDQISEQLMGTMGNALGTDSAQTSSALSGALPALLGGLTQSAESPAGANALFDSIQKQDDGLLGNVGALLGGSKASELSDQGGSILTSLLGGGALGKLADVVSSFAGISKGNSSSLMGMLAPIVLGALKNKVSSDGMNASSFASMLSGQKNNINAAMPQGFADKLSSAGVFDSLNTAQAAAATPSATSSTPDPVVQQSAASSGTSIFRWVLPVVGLLVAAVLGMQFFGGDKGEDAVATTQDVVSGAADSATNAASAASAKALEAAQEAMPDGVDLGEISTNLTGAFGSATDSLSGITDVDSATAALPAIEEVTGKLGGLSDVITRLPDAAKGPIGAIVETGLATLQPLIEKVSAIPGVGSVIEPVITPLMAMLEGLKG